MRKFSLPALVVAALFATTLAGAQQATVNGKTPKGVKVIKVKDAKSAVTATPTKKKRKKFLGIF